jgi:MYXO-CTERM domain-containing protein
VAGCRIDDACHPLGAPAPETPCAVCAADGDERWTARDEGDPCDDGRFCTVDDRCRDGACAGRRPRDCRALDGPCALGRCDEETAACLPYPLPDGTPCEADDDPCTRDACAAGLCAPGAPEPGCPAVAEPGPDAGGDVAEPLADVAVPLAEPTPDVAVPVAEPTPDVAVPAAEPTPDVAVPGAEPTPDVAVPGAEPTPDVAVPGAEPTPDGAVPVSEPTPDVAPGDAADAGRSDARDAAAPGADRIAPLPDDTAPPRDGGTDPSADAATPAARAHGGCGGCVTGQGSGGENGVIGLLVLGLGAVLSRRRRGRPGSYQRAAEPRVS